MPPEISDLMPLRVGPVVNPFDDCDDVVFVAYDRNMKPKFAFNSESLYVYGRPATIRTVRNEEGQSIPYWAAERAKQVPIKLRRDNV